ncbi:MAG: UDP-N-acetylmuramoyl-tripeptide--D-alanyl-D-alanine ligase [Flavobacteriaceae bacterium]
MTIEHLHALFLASTGISTDTRKINKGNLFFALKGENFNANTFAEKALKLGAGQAVIDEKKYHQHTGKTILVNDVLATLQELSAFHREYLKIPIIVLTGSNGKTTTKELIQAVLKEKYNIAATQGNLNNHIGVPLTLLSMNKSTEMGVVEMGANHHGEIAFLCELAKPDYGYITNFGKAHLEGFGSLEGVVQAKTELYRYLKKMDKTVFINTDDATQVIKTEKQNKITFSTENNSEINIILKEQNPFLTVIFQQVEIKSRLTGIYNLSNLAAAIAIGSHFDLTPLEIKKGIENYSPQNNRSQFLTKDTNTILMDAYNANPTSMQAALENFAQLDVPNKIVFLGDMFELGADASMEHEEIAKLTAEKKFKKVYLVGENFCETVVEDKSIVKLKSFEELRKTLDATKIIDSTLLIKGSRGMAMERILELI